VSQARSVFYRAYRELATELAGTYFAVSPAPSTDRLGGRLESRIVTNIYGAAPARARLGAMVLNDTSLTLMGEVEHDIQRYVSVQRDVIVDAAQVHRALFGLYNREAKARRLRRFFGEDPSAKLVDAAFARARDIDLADRLVLETDLVEVLAKEAGIARVTAQELRSTLTSGDEAVRLRAIHDALWARGAADWQPGNTVEAAAALKDLASVEFQFGRPLNLGRKELRSAALAWATLESMSAIDTYVDGTDPRNGLTALGAQLKPVLIVDREPEIQPRFLDQPILTRINQRLKGGERATPLAGDPVGILERAIRTAALPNGVGSRGSAILLALTADQTDVLEGAIEADTILSRELLAYFQREVHAGEIAGLNFTDRGMTRFLSLRADLLGNIAGRGFMLELAEAPVSSYTDAIAQLFSAVAHAAKEIGRAGPRLRGSAVIAENDDDSGTSVAEVAAARARADAATRLAYRAGAAGGAERAEIKAFLQAVSRGTGDAAEQNVVWQQWIYAFAKYTGRNWRELTTFELLCNLLRALSDLL